MTTETAKSIPASLNVGPLFYTSAHDAMFCCYADWYGDEGHGDTRCDTLFEWDGRTALEGTDPR